MPTREEIMAFVRQWLDQWVHSVDEAWIAIYRLLLDYIYGVPRITDSNRLKHGIWRDRAKDVEIKLAEALHCAPANVEDQLDMLMRSLYPATTQRMNPVGIAFACALVWLAQRFAGGDYRWKLEARIGRDIFPELPASRRKSVDIAAFHNDQPVAVISSKWGIRHDRIRDPQEEADTYKQQMPALKFFVVTNEFDSARLQKILNYPSIDGVFHARRDLVWGVYNPADTQLTHLRDLAELFFLL